MPGKCPAVSKTAAVKLGIEEPERRGLWQRLVVDDAVYKPSNGAASTSFLYEFHPRMQAPTREVGWEMDVTGQEVKRPRSAPSVRFLLVRMHVRRTGTDARITSPKQDT